MAAANLSRLRTILPDVFSREVAMLFAKSDPGIEVGFGISVGSFASGRGVGCGG